MVSVHNFIFLLRACPRQLGLSDRTHTK
jgi:hypothetical protein